MRLRCFPTMLAIFAVMVIHSASDAHAVLVSSIPKENSTITSSPKKAVLRFDARIEKKVSQVKLFKETGGKVALKSPSGGAENELIVALPKLKPGKYRLEYKVLASDGHLTPGLIRFTISGAKSP